eukprot:gnl/Chilomastix_caulleri/6999.p1 GENE.gnl/Chilomastix_caulleri/6999~~gnl/Chilomastix_caulleri/6999.p1  ORF type:complete len:104 (+),score=10.29 gnl/Chilomastix_caulleri/6999:13-324(+)
MFYHTSKMMVFLSDVIEQFNYLSKLYLAARIKYVNDVKFHRLKEIAISGFRLPNHSPTYSPMDNDVTTILQRKQLYNTWKAMLKVLVECASRFEKADKPSRIT